MEEVKTEGHPEMTLILIGNKCDLESERWISTEDGESFAK